VRIVGTVAGLRAARAEWRSGSARIGLVPTMGFLHEGHLALVDEARRRADRVVVSVFVNPLQFGPSEDLARYPRDFERDRSLLEQRGVDLLFAPAVDEMYPSPATVRLDPGRLAERWEGAIRPGHFAGVLTVVAKLFNQVEPDLACFGQKDIQQATLIRRMVRDLDWPLEVVVVPTVREPDGLALSSRNWYLQPEERARATVLSRALRAVQTGWRSGESRVAELSQLALAALSQAPGVTLDYFAIVDPEQLEPAPTAAAGSIALVAARVGPTRLIDNVILDRPIEA
jgi:pantoate--beta-alanine ligase